jgi:hypothetical protein
MLSKTHSIISYVIILFGLIHIYFVTCLDSFDTYALWFVGSGVAIIFAGLINLVKTKSAEKIVFRICLLTNFIMTVLFVTALITMQNPQVFIGIFIFAIAMILSLKKTT